MAWLLYTDLFLLQHKDHHWLINLFLLLHKDHHWVISLRSNIADLYDEEELTWSISDSMSLVSIDKEELTELISDLTAKFFLLYLCF